MKDDGDEEDKDDSEKSDVETKSDEEQEEEEDDDDFNNDEIVEYRQQLETELCFSGQTKANDSIRRYIESCSQYLSDMQIVEPITQTSNSVNSDCDDDVGKSVDNLNAEKNNDIKEVFEDPLDNVENATSLPNTLNTENDDEFFDAKSTVTICEWNDVLSEQEEEEQQEEHDDDVLGKLDTNSRMYRLKMVEKLLNDNRSQRSYSTTASTIAPSVITERIRRNLNKKEKQMERKRCTVKGEASAVHRHRKENKDIVKEYRGWEF